METVAAVPMRKEGTERPRATTGDEKSVEVIYFRVQKEVPGIVVVTAVPMPNRVEKAYAQLSLCEFTRAMSPVKN